MIGICSWCIQSQITSIRICQHLTKHDWDCREIERSRIGLSLGGLVARRGCNLHSDWKGIQYCISHAANDYYNEQVQKCNGTSVVDTLQPACLRCMLMELEWTTIKKRCSAITFFRSIICTTQVTLSFSTIEPSHVIHKPYQVPDQYLTMYKFINDTNQQYYNTIP